MMSAAARALEDGRAEMTVGDVLIALYRSEHLRPVLLETGRGEAAIRAALDRIQRPDGPSEAATG